MITTAGRPHAASLMIMPAGNVYAAWSLYRDPSPRRGAHHDHLEIASSRDGRNWDWIATLDSTSGEQAKLFRSGNVGYVLLRPDGGLFRLDPELHLPLVNGVDLRGGHTGLDLDAVATGPDSMLVAYSAWQDDPLGVPHQQMLLGHWAIAGGLARLDTLGVYTIEGGCPHVRIALVRGAPCLVADHPPNMGLTKEQRLPDAPRMRPGNSVFVQLRDHTWRSFAMPPLPEFGELTDAFARGRELHVFTVGEKVCETIISPGHAGGVAVVRGRTLGNTSLYNDWSGYPGGDDHARPATPVVWVRHLDAEELWWPPILGSILQLAAMDGNIGKDHAMLSWPDPSGGLTTRSEDLSRRLGLAGDEEALCVAGTGDAMHGELLIGTERNGGSFRLRLVRCTWAGAGAGRP